MFTEILNELFPANNNTLRNSADTISTSKPPCRRISDDTIPSVLEHNERAVSNLVSHEHSGNNTGDGTTLDSELDADIFGDDTTENLIPTVSRITEMTQNCSKISDATLLDSVSEETDIFGDDAMSDLQFSEVQSGRSEISDNTMTDLRHCAEISDAATNNSIQRTIEETIGEGQYTVGDWSKGRSLLDTATGKSIEVSFLYLHLLFKLK